MPDLSMLYMDFKGRAEPTRLALTLGDIPFEDERFKLEDFSKIVESGRLPFGQVPVLSIDGVAYTQSHAILCYAGKLTGLYPRDDDLLALYIDEVIDASEEVLQRLFRYHGKDENKVRESREEFVKKDMPRFLGGIEKLVKAKATSETWLCGKSLSVADLELYFIIGNIMCGNIAYVPPEYAEAYPRLLSSYYAVNEHPKIKQYNEKHPWKRR